MSPVCLHPVDPSDPLGVSVHQLENGLQVWLSVNREEPRIHASVVARVGSGEDPPDATGLAHYMEHMLANKGSARLGTLDAHAEAPLLAEISELFDRLYACADPDERELLLKRIDRLEVAASRFAVPNELKQAYARMGGRGFNATTSKERTNYFVDIPANLLERWMMLESDRFGAPVFRAFFSEVQTVVEEKNRSLDDAGRRSAAALDRLLWGEHPYANEILGRSEHLARPRVSRMRQFFDDWVVPGNMAVVLAGDLDPQQALALVERHFGDLRDRPTPPRASSASMPTIRGEQRVELFHHGPPAGHVAWRTVGIDHPDRPALRMADMLLDNGKTGLLDTRLNATGVVGRAGAYPRLYRDGGAEIVWVRPLAEQSLQEAMDLLLEQVERLREGDIDPSLLESIFLHWELGELAARESNKSRSGWMTSAFVHRQSWAEQRLELARHRAVTVQDIQRVAQQYFGPDRVVVLRQTGTPTEVPLPVPKVTARAIETEAHSRFFEEVLSTPVEEVAPRWLRRGVDWTEAHTGSGTIFANRNPHSELCQLSWVWDEGYERHPARSHALRLWSYAGVGDRSHLELERWVHGLGVRVGAHCGRHDTQLTLAGPSEAVLQVVDGLWQRVWSPVVDPTVAEALLQDAIARRQVNKGTKKVLVGAARGYALYGTDSTALGHTPSDEVVLGLLGPTPAGTPRFVDRLRSMVSTARDVLYTGRTPATELREVLAPLSVSVQAVPPRGPIQKARTNAPRVVVVRHASTQASVTVYRCAGPGGTERLAAGTVYAAMLGGSAGICFQELREARALAYATSGGFSFGLRPEDDDLLWARADTHASKVADAVSLLVEILHRPIEDIARFGRAREDVLQGLRTDRILPRGVPGAARWWAQRGFAGDPRPERLQDVTALDPDGLEAFRAGLSLQPPVVVVVGDLQKADVDALRRVGTVEECAADDLFGY